jgi:hypothetical protein
MTAGVEPDHQVEAEQRVTPLELFSIPLAVSADALVALAAVASVCSVLIAYEAIRFREARARVREAH